MSNEEKQLLLDLSKNTLAKSLGLEYKEIDASKINSRVGAFVTLKLNGYLRGCIGNIYAIKPLYQQIIELTLDAAFKDYRFEPVTKEEFNFIEFEISVLTEPKLIKNLSDFILSRDGIIIALGYNKAVFLPQVATETGWSKEELLSALCRKAGLNQDDYKNPEAMIYTFQAEVF